MRSYAGAIDIWEVGKDVGVNCLERKPGSTPSRYTLRTRARAVSAALAWFRPLVVPTEQPSNRVCQRCATL